MAARWLTLPSAELIEFVRSSVERVSVAVDRVEVSIDCVKLLNALGGGQASKEENVASIVLSIAANLRRAGKGRRLAIAGNAHREIDANLIALLRHPTRHLASLVRRDRTIEVAGRGCHGTFKAHWERDKTYMFQRVGWLGD